MDPSKRLALRFRPRDLGLPGQVELDALLRNLNHLAQEADGTEEQIFQKMLLECLQIRRSRLIAAQDEVHTPTVTTKKDFASRLMALEREIRAAERASGVTVTVRTRAVSVLVPVSGGL